jgi:hypothetical protein
MKQYLDYIGLNRDIAETPVFTTFLPLEKDQIEVAEKYLEYLKEIDHYQKDRRATIESKNSQLVGQASIVTSIFSLFVPLLIGNLKSVSLWISIPLCLLFLLIMVLFLLTIIHSIRTLEINRFKYATRSTSSLTKETRSITVIDFLNEEISDLIYIINHSTTIDNDKGQNLIFATRCFKIANIGFGILTVTIIISAFFFKNDTPEVRIKNMDEINLVIPDTISNYIINLSEVDTINVKIDDTLNIKN